jgi:hypothetical protein
MYVLKDVKAVDDVAEERVERLQREEQVPEGEA